MVSRGLFLCVRLGLVISLTACTGETETPDNGAPEETLRRVPTEYPSITAAITAAQDGDIVVVDAGEYNETIDFDGKSLTIKSSDPTDAAIVAATIIDGGGTGCVVNFEGEDVDAVLWGVTVRGGKAPASSSTQGGGVCVRNGATATLRANVIKENEAYAGGGVLVLASTATLENNTITANVADGRGSGVYVAAGAAATLRNNIISQNTGGSGAVHVRDAATTATIEDNTIAENTTDFGVGGIHIFTGAVATISGNTIHRNQGHSDFSAGGISVRRAVATISGNQITENLKTGGTGGAGVDISGHHSQDAQATLSGNTINGNTNESSSGGGIGVSYHASATLSENTISGNVAANWGGGIFVYNLGTNQEGDDHQIEIIDNQIVNNRLSGLYSGGGIALRGPAQATIAENTITGNATGTATVSGTRNGGGISLELANAVAKIYGNTIEDNTAASRGGGIFVAHNATALAASGTAWVRVNSPTGTETTNSYKGNAHSDSCGHDVFFGEQTCK